MTSVNLFDKLKALTCVCDFVNCRANKLREKSAHSDWLTVKARSNGHDS